MIHVLKWVLVTVLTGHGLLHLLGAVKGLGWAPVALLAQPIDAGAGAVWLVAALLILLAALMFARGTPPWWWAVALLGAGVSQIAIATSWGDAKFGTIANVVLVLLAGYGFAALGPTSFRTQWRGAAAEALADAEGSTSVVSEHDLAGLPGPLAAYVRRSGAVGRPRTTSLQARFHGRMRSAPGQAWMPFTGIQVNTFGPRPRRVFLMDASRAGLPVTVLHSFKNGTATMRAKLLSVLTVVDASGAEMDRGETVTVFNDLVVLAPAAIVDAPVQWAAVDAHHVRGTFVNGGQTVSAVLTFDADHDLVDFVSEDRLRASPDGTSFTRQEWSTPLSGHRYLDGRRILLAGRGQWHAPAPEGSFTYVELCMDQIAYNVGRTPPGTSPGVS
ncbi:MAG: hypothetical protein JWR20_2814 [Marmoricola sp.]|nr:hypothetical protein [Marmoricola sp.]